MKPAVKRAKVEVADMQAVADAEGYDFKGWSGSYNSKENPIFVKVDSDKNIIAEFSN